MVAGPILLITELEHGRQFGAQAASAALHGLITLAMFAVVFVWGVSPLLVLTLAGAAASLGPSLTGVLAPFPIATSVVAGFTRAQHGSAPHHQPAAWGPARPGRVRRVLLPRRYPARQS